MEPCWNQNVVQTGHNYNEMQAHYKLHRRLFDDDEYYNRLREYMRKLLAIVCDYDESVIYGYCHWSIIITLNYFCTSNTFINYWSKNDSLKRFQIDSMTIRGGKYDEKRQITGSGENLIRMCAIIKRGWIYAVNCAHRWCCADFLADSAECH